MIFQYPNILISSQYRTDLSRLLPVGTSFARQATTIIGDKSSTDVEIFLRKDNKLLLSDYDSLLSLGELLSN